MYVPAIRTLHGFCPDGALNPMSVEIADPNYFELKSTPMTRPPRSRNTIVKSSQVSIMSDAGHCSTAPQPAPAAVVPSARHSATPHSQIPQTPRVDCFVFDISNLPTYASVCHLYNTFFSYGHILAVHIDPFWTGSSVVCSGTGGISLHTTSDFAAKILTDLDGAIVFGPLHPIGVGAYSRCVSQ